MLVRNDPRDVVAATELSRAKYMKMIQKPVWATSYSLVAIPVAAGVLVPWGIDLPMAVVALAMRMSTIVVAANAQLLRRVRLRPGLVPSGGWPRPDLQKINPDPVPVPLAVGPVGSSGGACSWKGRTSDDPYPGSARVDTVPRLSRARGLALNVRRATAARAIPRSGSSFSDSIRWKPRPHRSACSLAPTSTS